MAKISIIVPVYNEEARLQKCIQSILSQTMQDFELILIDDGSQDHSYDIMQQYQKQYPQQIVLLKQENKGQGSARNLGLKNCQASLITFVDSDDIIEKEMLQTLYETQQQYQADIVICNLYKNSGEKQLYFKNYDAFTADSVRNFMVSHPGPVGRLYKKELFIQHHLYFLEQVIYEDLGVIPLLGIYANTVIALDKAYYHYMIREGSTMQQKQYNSKLENIFFILQHLTNEFEKRSHAKYQEELEYLYIEHLLYSASLRFANYLKEGKPHLQKIQKIMKEKYPHYKKNKYYCQKSNKFKLICFLSYHKQIFLLHLIGKLR